MLKLLKNEDAVVKSEKNSPHKIPEKTKPQANKN